MICEEDGSANFAPPPSGRTGRESSGSGRDLTNVYACAVHARAASLSDGDREEDRGSHPIRTSSLPRSMCLARLREA